MNGTVLIFKQISRVIIIKAALVQGLASYPCCASVRSGRDGFQSYCFRNKQERMLTGWNYR